MSSSLSYFLQPPVASSLLRYIHIFSPPVQLMFFPDVTGGVLLLLKKQNYTLFPALRRPFGTATRCCVSAVVSCTKLSYNVNATNFGYLAF
jgi:hypothetical protein